MDILLIVNLKWGGYSLPPYLFVQSPPSIGFRSGLDASRTSKTNARTEPYRSVFLKFVYRARSIGTGFQRGQNAAEVLRDFVAIFSAIANDRVIYKTPNKFNVFGPGT